MNWEALGAIGELIGAAGVIGTLVYLAVQIRRATRFPKAPASLFLPGHPIDSLNFQWTSRYGSYFMARRAATDDSRRLGSAGRVMRQIKLLAARRT
jgi:hypothetical protein